MGLTRSIQAMKRLEEQRMTSGFTSFGLRGTSDAPLDPILSLDDFRMSEPTFPPHPHAGFSAVTYMFEDSAGTFTNRDSRGDRSAIGPGALHWTQAGRGMMHEEIPKVPGVESHGIQMFVNLRRAHKLADPKAFHVEAKDVPEVRGAGSRTRVLAGELLGHASPLSELLTPILFLDVHLDARAELRLPLPVGHNGFVLAIAGEGFVGAEGERHALGAHVAAVFAQDGDEVQLAAGSSGLHVLLVGGQPLGEPVVFGGPFAMTSRAEVQDAFARFERGEMGRLEPSFAVARR